MAELKAFVPAQGTAGSTQDQVIGETQHAGKVREVTLIPEAGVTGNATNFRTFRVLNRGQTGAGSTLVASFATNATPANDLTAFDERSLTLSGTAANLNVAEGDVLVADETVGGTGVTHAGYTIRVTYSADAA
jgi:hypothetical protein